MGSLLENQLFRILLIGNWIRPLSFSISPKVLFLTMGTGIVKHNRI